MRWIFLLLLFTSCAQYSIKTMRDATSRICLQQEGKGRFEAGPEKFVFNFETALVEKKWYLALTIPLHGEEALIYDLDKKLFDGDFINRLKKALVASGKFKSFEIELFMKGFGHSVGIITDSKLMTSCASNESDLCRLDAQTQIRKMEKSLELKHQMKSGFELSVAWKYPTKTGFERQSIELKRVLKGKIKKIMGLELFANNCRK